MYYPRYLYFRRGNISKPVADWGQGRPRRDPVEGNVTLGLKHHSLQGYIGLIGRERRRIQNNPVERVDEVGEDVVGQAGAHQHEEQGNIGDTQG